MFSILKMTKKELYILGAAVDRLVESAYRGEFEEDNDFYWEDMHDLQARVHNLIEDLEE